MRKMLKKLWRRCCCLFEYDKMTVLVWNTFFGYCFGEINPRDTDLQAYGKLVAEKLCFLFNNGDKLFRDTTLVADLSDEEILRCSYHVRLGGVWELLWHARIEAEEHDKRLRRFFEKANNFFCFPISYPAKLLSKGCCSWCKVQVFPADTPALTRERDLLSINLFGSHYDMQIPSSSLRKIFDRHGNFYRRRGVYISDLPVDVDVESGAVDPSSSPVHVEEQPHTDTKNSATEDDWKCVVCQDRDRSVVFKPCRHFILCQECFDLLKRNDSSTRRNILGNTAKENGNITAPRRRIVEGLLVWFETCASTSREESSASTPACPLCRGIISVAGNVRVY